MASPKKQIPEFRSEEDEFKFWTRHDSTAFIDWQSARRRRLPNLKRTRVTAIEKGVDANQDSLDRS